MKEINSHNYQTTGKCILYSINISSGVISTNIQLLIKDTYPIVNQQAEALEKILKNPPYMLDGFLVQHRNFVKTKIKIQ